MARAFTAKKSTAGKEIKCGRCGAAIKPGEQYFYFSVGFRGSKQYRCYLHSPRQSELCGSKMSGAYAANESIEATLNDPEVTIEGIASELESAANEIEQVRDEYQESYDNLPQGFQDGEQGSDIQEKIDGLTEYADALTEKASEIRDMETEQTDVSMDPDADPDEAPADDDDDLLQQAKDLAEGVLGEFLL